MVAAITYCPVFSDPHLSALGLLGKCDVLGTLNLLTEEVVRAAASELRMESKFVHLASPIDLVWKTEV